MFATAGRRSRQATTTRTPAWRFCALEPRWNWNAKGPITKPRWNAKRPITKPRWPICSAPFRPRSWRRPSFVTNSATEEIINESCRNAWEDECGHRFLYKNESGVAQLADAAVTTDDGGPSPAGTDGSPAGSPTESRNEARLHSAILAALVGAVEDGAVADGAARADAVSGGAVAAGTVAAGEVPGGTLAVGVVSDTSREVKKFTLRRTVRVAGASSLQYVLTRSFSGTHGDISVAEGFQLSPASSSPSLLSKRLVELVTVASMQTRGVLIEVKAGVKVQPAHVYQATVAAWSYLSERTSAKLVVAVVTPKYIKIGFAQREDGGGTAGTLAVRWRQQTGHSFPLERDSRRSTTSDAGSTHLPDGPGPESGPASGVVPPGPPPSLGRRGRSGGSTKRQRRDTAAQDPIAVAVAGRSRPNAEAESALEFTSPWFDAWPDTNGTNGRVRRWMEGVAGPRAVCCA